MDDVVVVLAPEQQLVTQSHLDTSLAEFAKRKDMLVALRARRDLAIAHPANTAVGYEDRRVAVAAYRKFRTDGEKARVALKADSLAFGRKVDEIAGELSAEAKLHEEALKAEMKVVDDAKKALADAKALAARKAIEDEIKAKQDAENARLQAERDAEEERKRVQREAYEKSLAEAREKKEAELRAEADRLSKIAAEQKAERLRTLAEQKAAQDRIDAANAEIAKQKQALADEQERINAAERARLKKLADDLAEQERLAKERADAVAKAEADRIFAAEQAKIKAETDRLAAELAAAKRPDREKLQALSVTLRAVVMPEMTTDDGREVLAQAVEGIEAVAKFCEEWE